MGYARPTARTAARPIDRIFQVSSQVPFQVLYPAHVLFENRSLVDFQTGNEHYGVWRSFLTLKVDPWLILLEGNEGFGDFEANRLKNRILSKQRTWRGRDWDFIYTMNFVRQRSGFYLHKEFRGAGVRFYLHKPFMGPVFSSGEKLKGERLAVFSTENCSLVFKIGQAKCHFACQHRERST